MAGQERSVETNASPQAVWRVWSDTSTWPEWNPDVQSITLDGPFATGTSGTMKTKQGTRQVQLTEVLPGRSFRLETTVIPLTRFAFACRVAAGPAGNTTISQGIRVGGPAGKSPTRFRACSRASRARPKRAKDAAKGWSPRRASGVWRPFR